MLQPSQLIGVCVRYPGEILEIRTFLAKAGLTPCTAEALHCIVERLRLDRAFQRDLTSQVWVAIHRSDPAIGYSDLLGILAVAGAGTHFAGAAEASDAHHLLRFLSEARRSFEAVQEEWAGSSADAAAEMADMPPTTPADPRANDLGLSEPSLGPFHRNSFLPRSSEDRKGGWRRVASRTAACVVFALALGAWLKHQSPMNQTNSSTSVSPAARTATPVDPSLATRGLSLRSSDATVSRVLRSPLVRARPRVRPFTANAPTSREVEQDILPQTAPFPVSPAQAATHSRIGQTSNQAIARLSPPAPTVRPAAPSAAAPSAAPEVFRTVDIPRLLRRTDPAASAASSADYADLTPGVRLSGASTIAEADGIVVANSTRGGIVRPTSLGIMAANVLYSPLPAYPAAASIAHVQGEVKVEAHVDRNGRVASARVISGPPLLREAALDALQRWRYRPYISYGKPEPKTALAIVDFQLP